MSLDDLLTDILGPVTPVEPESSYDDPTLYREWTLTGEES